MFIASTVMAESGLGGRFWLKAAAAWKDERKLLARHTSRLHLIRQCTEKEKKY